MTSYSIERTVTIAGSIFSIVTGVGWLVEKVSPIWFAGSCFATFGIVAILHFKSRSKVLQPTDDSLNILPSTQQLAGRIRIDKSPYVDGPTDWDFVYAAQERDNQEHYQSAFDALTTGLCGEIGAQIATRVNDWVKWEYCQHIERYPGATGEGLKRRYYVKAFEFLKTGKFFIGENISERQIVPVVAAIERFVATRTYHGP